MHDFHGLLPETLGGLWLIGLLRRLSLPQSKGWLSVSVAGEYGSRQEHSITLHDPRTLLSALNTCRHRTRANRREVRRAGAHAGRAGGGGGVRKRREPDSCSEWVWRVLCAAPTNLHREEITPALPFRGRNRNRTLRAIARKYFPVIPCASTSGEAARYRDVTAALRQSNHSTAGLRSVSKKAVQRGAARLLKHKRKRRATAGHVSGGQATRMHLRVSRQSMPPSCCSKLGRFVHKSGRAGPQDTG